MDKIIIFLGIAFLFSTTTGDRVGVGSLVCSGSGWSNLKRCTCSCQDTTTFSFANKAWKKKKAVWYPCGGKTNVESCNCNNGKEAGKNFVKVCGRGRKNLPASCQCVDGSIWSKVNSTNSGLKQTGCGIQNGKDTEEGDSWIHLDGCNTCTCVNGVPACTSQSCSQDPQCKDSQGTLRQEGDSWTQPDGCNTCTCINGVPACTKQLCGEQLLCKDSQQEGGSWIHPDGCNTCACINGLQACTKQLCGEQPPCRDSLGNLRDPGSSWTHEDGCNKCQCNNGLQACTRMSCGAIRTAMTDGSCVDSQGNKRTNGSYWTHEDGCNTCWCSNGLVPCTRKYCQDGPMQGVSCGGHSAEDCSKCVPLGEGANFCNGVCTWINDTCILASQGRRSGRSKPCHGHGWKTLTGCSCQCKNGQTWTWVKKPNNQTYG